MASSLSFPILIPFAMESPSCVTVPHMAFSKPPKHHRPLVRGRVRVRPVNRRLNSATLFRCSSAADDAVITLHVGGMMCEGCANSVKKLLESRPHVLSARVNLASEIAIVSPAPEEKPAPNYLKRLGEELAQHLTTCGFTSTLQGKLACLSLKLDKIIPRFEYTLDGSSKVSTLLHYSKYKEDMHQRFPSLIVVASNILMFSMPNTALAETCEADNSFFNMPILLAVALIGATVGGLLARQRRNELQRVNEQLIQINAALRKQAKIESYAPSLSYAPIGGGRIPDNEIIVDPKKQELISKLKNGKNFLRNQQLDKAFIEFKNALELAQNLKDPIEEKKAARGLGASLQRQGKYRDAIKYHSMVLAISEREGEDSGNTEAFGAIADCYTELGELEKAGQFYDKYIARLEKD
ncbi:Protein FLUORESCENT IN BLUE [Vigna angularis]|uniref:Protein FLUORESCENT IN BLUE n=2 Tax=Phaseolus angularis TaxID=3914 RepID=A0A8T0K8Z6_PHAAN|nr:protein FLUORESCENT IN BLUE LIGHT, chloroplastic isoform X1 [Vigna angularis]XP_017436795.1 protein FLUORESCENT IN BLUE LIGHT, chloroplastic isoform X1 [Vigna angularis]XP_052734913.1 protein FLUORESCENT IN BLUE LIGHT, chloroplastic isoform X1 [Vigna angularis]KAG2396257.1 Protein FLUORESCENT IN BLUE [Vigna angularis]BAT86871.1 hypothetical protein VIGAN_05019800 [Vigna angularis var. angularis]